MSNTDTTARTVFAIWILGMATIGIAGLSGCAIEQQVEIPEIETEQGGDTEQIGDGPNTDTEVIEDNEPECSFTMETWDGDVEFANELEWYTSLGTPYGTVEVGPSVEVSRFFLRAPHEECGDLNITALTLYPSVSDLSNSDWYRNIGEVKLVDVVTGEVLGTTTPSICFEDGCPQNTIWFGDDPERVEDWQGIYLTAGQPREIGVFIDLVNGRDGETIKVSWAPSQTGIEDIESGESYVLKHDTMLGNELEIVRYEDLELDVTFTTTWSAQVPFPVYAGQEEANFGAWMFQSETVEAISVGDVAVLSYVDADGDGIFYHGEEDGVSANRYLQNCMFKEVVSRNIIMGPMDLDSIGFALFTDDFVVQGENLMAMNFVCDISPDVDELDYAAFAFHIQTGDVQSSAAVTWYHSANVDYVGDAGTTVTLAAYVDNR